ncbi:MAG TPA: right-handed parallel beta-helix repeat-containing protein [Longimicrobium sp.]|jgi:hypothetical protein
MIKRVLASALCLGAMAMAAPSHASAQATRTWVSGVGDDVNPCSRTAPCKTFAGAISKTAAGGEIDCLDPGGFGGVTITKSITIDCNGVVGSALFAGATSGISVNGTDIVVVLRNLQVNGAGTGQVGIRFVNGKRLVIENVLVSQASQTGILVNSMAGSGHVVINNSQIINGTNDGIRVSYGVTSINNSTIAGNSIFALIAENGGVINANNNMITYNGIAVQAGNGGAGQSGSFVNVSNNGVHGNLTAFVCAGGFVASDGSNRLSNNAGGGAAPCTPNATITKQ